MKVNTDTLLSQLPPYMGNDVLIKRKQSTRDIVQEIKDAHEAFKPDYDKIAPYFRQDPHLYRTLFDYVRKAVPYDIESHKKQTTMSPAAMLALRKGDCKHYSSFIGGVLGALNRAGYGPYDWVYRFAEYGSDDDIGHVFVVVNPGSRNEVWIDPAPIKSYWGGWKDRTFNDRMTLPKAYYDLNISDMSLSRISGSSASEVPAGFFSNSVIMRPVEEEPKKCCAGCAGESGISGIMSTLVSYAKANPFETAAISGLLAWGLYEAFKKK